MSDNLQAATEQLSRVLSQAEKVFIPTERMKLTLIARHPTDPERWLVLTSDEIPNVIELLNRYNSGIPTP